MIRIAVCDDDQTQLSDIAKKIRQCCNYMNVQCQIDTFDSGTDLLMTESDYYQIIFLDIQMAKLNGIETAARVRENNIQTVLVFVSAFDCYCKELISVQPYAFFDKPLDESQLLPIMQKIYQNFFYNMDSLSFTSNKVTYSIPIKDIMYIESSLRKVQIFCSDGQVYSYYAKLDSLENILIKKAIVFIRIHQSYLINTQYIRSYTYESITLHNGIQIDISKKYRPQIRQQFFDALKREDL